MKLIDTASLRDWQSLARNFVLVDTLPSDSFVNGHLPGAINIVSDDILRHAPEVLVDKHALIVVYCASAACKRAGLSAERLESLGYTRVHHFVGGKKEWIDAGYPLAAGRA